MERCSDHENLAEEVKNIGLSVARTEEIVKSAIKEVTNHITAGSKWRAIIVTSCIGLIGGAVAIIVRFSVMEYKVCKLQEEGWQMQDQIYDLNFEKGRAVGLQEKR